MNHEPSTLRQKELFIAALEISDASERARFLEEACGGDAVLKRRVESLLRADADAGAFREPAADAGSSIGYFGDYVLLDEIARGASGVVFRARQTSLNRIVALKMLRDRPLLTTDEDLRRFRAEAQAAAGLDHPGIVPIYEVGQHEGQGYFSMKFIEGGTLHLRAGEFREPRKAVTLIARVARAVHHAHERGILHRDLKPGNILIDRDGSPLVVDFGIARRMGVDSSLTHTGQIIGTPHYMAPEQARGVQRDLTAAADTYSLGAILYELLAGKKLFDGGTMLTLLRQVTEQAPAPLRIGDGDLESIVMRCLEKAPAARHASAAALADELERWLRGERPVNTGSWSRRRFAYAALGLVGAGGVAAWLVKDKQPSPARAAASAKTPLPERGTPAASRAVAEWFRRLPKHAGESHIAISTGGNATLFEADSLPPGDWHIVRMWLDRINTSGLPPVDADVFLEHMGLLTTLDEFFLRFIPLPDKAYAFAAQNPGLRKFIIEGGKSGDELTTHLRGLENLQVLKVGNMPENKGGFTGAGFENVAFLPVLEQVIFANSVVTDSIFPVLLKCPKLRAVDVSNTLVTDKGLVTLAAAPSLVSITIDENPAITDAILPVFAGMPRLKLVSARSIRFTKAAVDAFVTARPECEFLHDVK